MRQNLSSSKVLLLLFTNKLKLIRGELIPEIQALTSTYLPSTFERVPANMWEDDENVELT